MKIFSRFFPNFGGRLLFSQAPQGHDSTAIVQEISSSIDSVGILAGLFRAGPTSARPDLLSPGPRYRDLPQFIVSRDVPQLLAISCLSFLQFWDVPRFKLLGGGKRISLKLFRARGAYSHEQPVILIAEALNISENIKFPNYWVGQEPSCPPRVTSLIVSQF